MGLFHTILGGSEINVYEQLMLHDRVRKKSSNRGREGEGGSLITLTFPNCKKYSLMSSSVVSELNPPTKILLI